MHQRSATCRSWLRMGSPADRSAHQRCQHIAAMRHVTAPSRSSVVLILGALPSRSRHGSSEALHVGRWISDLCQHICGVLTHLGWEITDLGFSVRVPDWMPECPHVAGARVVERREAPEVNYRWV